jgi:hypothetical protein
MHKNIHSQLHRLQRPHCHYQPRILYYTHTTTEASSGYGHTPNALWVQFRRTQLRARATCQTAQGVLSQQLMLQYKRESLNMHGACCLYVPNRKQILHLLIGSQPQQQPNRGTQHLFPSSRLLILRVPCTEHRVYVHNLLKELSFRRNI